MTRHGSLRGHNPPLEDYVRRLAAGPLVDGRERPTSVNARHVSNQPLDGRATSSIALTLPSQDDVMIIDLRNSDTQYHDVDESTANYIARRIREADFVILPNTSRVYAFLKRTTDLVGALLLLILSLPFLALLTMLIRLDSPGPAFFRQIRVTKNGRHFTFIKFRTMYIDARERYPEYYAIDVRGINIDESTDDVYYKISDDPRNTRVGRWLRRTTLDELPNLFNVLRGDISLVGPRPDIPELVRRYRPIELSCLLAKAGMTGAAQTRGRSLLTIRERLRLDLQYVSHQSLWLDLKIMGRTILVVFIGRGAF